MAEKSRAEIDFVITWVDGSDPAWQKEKAEYSGRKNIQDEEMDSVDTRDMRYREHGLLRYWFRGVEKFAPWVRKIHFVTWGHIPEWLDTDNPKLNIVRHEDFIPKEFLPTFNSNVIEMHMHRIKGLSEHFVYFNDDVFLAGRTKETDFFKGGKPCDMLALRPVVVNLKNPVMPYMLLNGIFVISKYFNKRENAMRQPGKYFKPGYSPACFFYNLIEMASPKFTGFFNVHGAFPFCKQTYNEIWEKEEEQLLETSSHRFRSKDDLTIYLFRDWQKMAGNFHAQNLLRDFKYFELADDNSRLCRTINSRKKKIICINDSNDKLDYERSTKPVSEAFEKILPERSSFEKA